MVKTSKRGSAKPKKDVTVVHPENVKTVVTAKLPPETKMEKHWRYSYAANPDGEGATKARLIGERLCRWANGSCNCAGNNYPKLCSNVEEITAAVLGIAG